MCIIPSYPWTSGDNIPRIDVLNYHGVGNLQSAFHFNAAGHLILIMFNPGENPNAPIHFCVYGSATGLYFRRFNDPRVAGSIGKCIPVYSTLGRGIVRFRGFYVIKYIGPQRKPSICKKTNHRGVLVGEIDLAPCDGKD